ncbi:MAG: 30S ribosomal protein S7 [Anaerolineales bacterium]|nr:30S ribosomal protein S7 [Anaerolineales bacterium]
MRRTKPEKRELTPDVRYNSRLVTSFINRLMKKGKRSTAITILYDAFDMIEERLNRPPLEVFEEAIENTSPILEVKPRRVGGATYQVPVEVDPDRRLALSMRWLLSAARSRPGKTMADKLAGELMDAAGNTGSAVKKKEDTHRMAEANRAFAHYRW